MKLKQKIKKNYLWKKINYNICIRRWATEGLKLWLCLGQKSSYTYPVWEKDKMNAILCQSIAIQQIHVTVIAFLSLEYEQISFSKSNQSCRQYPVYDYNKFARNHIPHLGPICIKLYTMLRRERYNSVPCLATHPHIAFFISYMHVWELKHGLNELHNKLQWKEQKRNLN